MTTKQTPAERLARALLKRARKDDQQLTNPPHTVTTHDKPTDAGKLLAADGDAYAALSKAATRPAVGNTARRYIALATRGWAAPTKPDQPNDQTPPSLHPERRRVTLVVVHDTTTNKQTSALHIAGQRAVVVDHGDAHGALADALAKTAAQLTTPPAA